MFVDSQINSPLVVGGLGGSGTRIVAEILIKSSVFMGFAHNRALDNVLFTLLFKRRDWLLSRLDKNDDFSVALSTHEKLLRGSRKLTPAEAWFLSTVLYDWFVNSNLVDGLDRGWAKRIVKTELFKLGQVACTRVGWGWKEPNSHLLLNQIFRYYPNARYIHVIRHGLDMALSENRQQLENWGGWLLKGHDLTGHSVESKMLKAWIVVNERVMAIRQRVGRERILVVSHEDICRDPESTIRAMLKFAGNYISEEQVSGLARLVAEPATMGRGKELDIGLFDPSDLEKVKSYGFDV